MADQLFLGIDSGTQGTKAVLVSRERRRVVAQAYAPHDLTEAESGKREQDPAWWIDACTRVIAEVVASAPNRASVRAIGVSGQQHGMVPLDASGEVIRAAKLWCDTETARQCEEITTRAGGRERVTELTGNAVAAGFTASKVLWMQQEEPDNFERLARILLPHEYINYWLTGVQRSEPGDASGTAYYDVRRRDWSLEMVAAIDPTGRMRECLPELIGSRDPVATIRKEIADRFGLAADVLVASGGGDNMMAAIGTGNVMPGVVTTSLGTSGTIYAASDAPVVDPNGEVAAFCSSSGAWLPLVCTMNVTVATELTRALLGLDVEAFNAAAAQAPIGAGGILLLPYFNGERTPALPEARGVLFGLSSTNYSAPNLCRSAMEGVTMGLRYGLDALRARGIAPKEIRLVGGGARSVLWRRIVADLFECQVVCPEVAEAGALGAALQAMWCYLNQHEAETDLAGITQAFVMPDETTRVEPEERSCAEYRGRYQHYTALSDHMEPLFERGT